MKSILFIAIMLLAPAWAQTPKAATSATPVAVTGGRHVNLMYRGEMGKWWQNSDVAKKLNLSEGQISQLDQTFLEHRMKLIDYGADMEKQDLKLQALLDADVPNEGQIESQVDQVLGARGKLEREYTMMNLDLRKVLSLEQWRQLKSIRGERGGFGDRIFFKTIQPGPGPVTIPLPPGEAPPPLPPAPPGAFLAPPPLPPLDADDLF
jgi:Spy/CpxP family protein refolding chaperone